MTMHNLLLEDESEDTGVPWFSLRQKAAISISMYMLVCCILLLSMFPGLSQAWERMIGAGKYEEMGPTIIGWDSETQRPDSQNPENWKISTGQGLVKLRTIKLWIQNRIVD